MKYSEKFKKLFEYAKKKYSGYIWIVKIPEDDPCPLDVMTTIGVKSKHHKKQRKGIYYGVDTNEDVKDLKKLIDSMYLAMKEKPIVFIPEGAVSKEGELTGLGGKI